MKNIAAIALKELYTYFVSPVAYFVFLSSRRSLAFSLFSSFTMCFVPKCQSTKLWGVYSRL